MQSALRSTCRHLCLDLHSPTLTLIGSYICLWGAVSCQNRHGTCPVNVSPPHYHTLNSPEGRRCYLPWAMRMHCVLQSGILMWGLWLRTWPENTLEGKPNYDSITEYHMRWRRYKKATSCPRIKCLLMHVWAHSRLFSLSFLFFCLSFFLCLNLYIGLIKLTYQASRAQLMIWDHWPDPLDHLIHDELKTNCIFLW